MNDSKLLTPTALLLTAALCGCMGENKGNPTRTAAVLELAATADRSRPALDEDRLGSFGFQLHWDSFIRDEVITSLSLEGNQIYVFTRSKRLYQVDMHSGMVNWVYNVDRPLEFAKTGRPITEWTYEYQEDIKTRKRYKQYDEIFFVAGDHLYSLDKKNGSELWQIYLPFTPSSAPQAGRTHVFLGSWDDRIYAIRKDRPLIPDWSWRTDDDVLARPAVHGPTLFVASTDGQMHSFEGATGKLKLPFQTERRLKQDMLIHKSLVYLPAEDFNLYVVGATDGLLHYRYCAGAPISGRPVAVEKSIYFPAVGKGMFSILRKGRPKKTEGNPRKTTHELLWLRKGATQVLAKGMSDIYLLEPGKSFSKATVTRIAAKDGHFRDGIDFENVDFWLTNPFSPLALERDDALRGGVILMGFRNGWIFALKEKATIPGA